jgi:CRISPR-associated protein Csb3
MSFEVRVDVTNPGQFFACCGLLELASRLDPSARGQFVQNVFAVDAARDLGDIIGALAREPLIQVVDDDETSSPIHIPPPFGLRLDWWKDEATGGRELKVWAGSMQSLRIARAMLSAIRDPKLHDASLLDHGLVVYDPDNPAKKVEPFYFDARRAPNAHSRDIGFSPNDLELTTTAFPAVEALCLVGLQRFRPTRTQQRRVFDYQTWGSPLPAAIAAAVACRAVSLPHVRTYRFECWFRTGQKKQKAFRPAVLVAEGEG